MTRDELAGSAKLDSATLEALETFGLLRPDATGHYGEAALSIAHTAAGLAAYGIEPRHLRPFRTAADREIGWSSRSSRPTGASPGGPPRPTRRRRSCGCASACTPPWSRTA